MTLINLFWGWVYANVHGLQNQDFVPWGDRQFAYDYAGCRSINRSGASFPELVRWVVCCMKEHAITGWHYAAMIDIAESWED